MKAYQLLILFLLFSSIAFSQSEEEIVVQKKKVKFVLGFDSRNSYTLGRPVGVQGLKIGAEFRGKYRMGLGVYSLKKDILIKENLLDTGKIQSFFSFKHSNIFYERILYHDFKWDISVPVTLGVGNSIFYRLNTTTRKKSDEIKGQDLGVVTLGVESYYKVYPWIGLGAGLGYRQLITPNTQARKSLSAPFYSLEVKIFLGYVYKCIFKPAVVRAEKQAYKNRKKKTKQ